MTKKVKRLSSQTFVLLGLAFTERDGAELQREYERETGSPILPASVFTVMRRLRDEGLVVIKRAESIDQRTTFKASAEGQRAHRQTLSSYQSYVEFGRRVHERLALVWARV